jgi:uncharacterized protein affecting Mg2+/Co2+ transport
LGYQKAIANYDRRIGASELRAHRCQPMRQRDVHKYTLVVEYHDSTSLVWQLFQKRWLRYKTQAKKKKKQTNGKKTNGKKNCVPTTTMFLPAARAIS